MGALLVIGGLLPGWTVDVLIVDLGSGDPAATANSINYRLLSDGAWPYYLGLALAVAGVVGAAAAHGYPSRGWLPPTVLTLTAVPALALLTELADPPDYAAPYAGTAEEATRQTYESRGLTTTGIFTDVEVEAAVGGWITFFTALGLALFSVLWLGRSLGLLAHRRYALGALVLVVVVSIVGYQLAEAVADHTCDPGPPVDPEDVSTDWLFWLVVYLPAVMAGIGIGAATRRRFVSGALLVAGAAAAFVGMLVIGVEIAGPCLA